MAIQNASDLLVYLNFPNAVKQVTRIKILTSNPLSTFSANSSTIKIENATNASGVEQSDITTNPSSANTAAIILSLINTKLVGGQGYVETKGNTVEGDYTFRDFENGQGGFVSNLNIINGSGVFATDAVVIEILTTGANTGNTPIAFSTNASLSINTDLRDCTNKDSLSFAKYEQGLLNFEVSTDALQDFTNVLDYKELFNFITVGDEVNLKFSQRLTGATETQFKGSARVTSLSMDAGVEENATYSATFTGTGNLTVATE